MYVKEFINIHYFCLCMCMCADTYTIMLPLFFVRNFQTEVFQSVIKHTFFPQALNCSYGCYSIVTIYGDQRVVCIVTLPVLLMPQTGEIIPSSPSLLGLCIHPSLAICATLFHWGLLLVTV